MRKLYLIMISLIIAQMCFAQVSGTFTIPGATYPTIASAITAINASGVGAGGATFSVTAGYTETFSTATAGLLSTATSSLANPIIFQKSGPGSNPVITAGAGSGSADYIICISGTNYVTFDGIDVQEAAGNTTTNAQMEWGYAILKASATRGSQNVVIKNCNITLNKNNTVTYGIYQNNITPAAPTTQLTITTSAGTSSNNKFYNNTITNVYGGIYLSGYADGVSPYTYYDQNNDIGSVTGNTFSNFAGGSATSYVAYAAYQNGLIFANSMINGGAGTTGTLYAFYGGTANNASANIYGNTITLTSAATSSNLYGIYNSALGAGGTNNTLNIYNNSVVNSAWPTSTTGYFYGIYNLATGFIINMYGNQVNNNIIGGSYYTYLLYTTSSATGTSNVYNNTINGNQRSGVGTQSGSAYLYCLYLSGSGTIVCHDNIITSNTCPAQSVYGAYIYSVYASNSALNQNIYNNTIHDQSITSSNTSAHAVYGIYSYPSSANALTNSTYNNNVYNLNIALSSTGYGYIYGIYGYYVGNIYSNTMYNLSVTNSSTGYGYGYGYYFGGTNNGSLYKNSLYNVSMAGTSGYFYGIYETSGATLNIYNNFISDLRAPASTSGSALDGIYLSGGTSTGIYFNTIYLNASSTSASTYGTNCIYASTSVNVELRNNILVNLSTAPGSATYSSTAYRRSTTSLASYTATSDNNDLYSGTPSANRLVFSDGTNNIQTIQAYRTFVSPRDASAVTENPPFVNVATTPYNLHLQTTVYTQCESGGSVVTTPAINNDIDNDARFPNAGYPNNATTPATAPDIGADEFGGLLSHIIPPTITFNPLLNTSSLSARTLTTTITDGAGVPTSGIGLPRLCWKKFGTGTWNSSIATYVGGSTYTFSFGSGVVLNDSIYYYVVAQDLTATPNVSSNPWNGSGYTSNPPAAGTPPPNSSLYSYRIVSTLCGTYMVGAGQTYPTITAAVADLNMKETSCPVIFQLTDANYASETFPITFNQSAGVSNINTVLFRPAPGITPTITGNSTTALFKFNHATNITFDGSNSGGTDRSMTITNTSASGTTSVFWVASAGSGLGSTNISVKNCNISNGFNGSSSYCIFAGSNQSIGTAGDDNDNLTIQNNAISKAYYGIYVYATLTGMDDNLLISSNTIGSATVTSYVQYNGIFLSGTNAPLVTGNEIYNMIGTPSNIYGIELNTNVLNAMVSNNKIHDMQDYSAGGWGVFGINVGSGANVLNATIENNIIYNLTTINYSTSSTIYNPFGIRIVGGTGHKVYHNTVNMTGTQYASGSSGTLSAALLITTPAVTGLDVRDNIFTNNLTGLAGSTSFCVYAASGTIFGNINYNDYYPSGTYGILGYLGSNYTTLATWQGATAQDAGSRSTDPVFVSATDFHPTTPLLAKAGLYIPVASNDFAGTPRSNPPDIGAYQYSADPLVTTVAATVIGSSTATLNGTINANSATVSSSFEYGLTTAYGSTIAGLPLTVSGTTVTSTTASVTGLNPCTVYHFRAKGSTGAINANGADMTFTTGSVTPAATTVAASGITATAATLNGTITANNVNTNVTFDYGLTTSYGTTVAGVPNPVNGNTPTSVSVNISGLAPGTTYHYRVNGSNTCATANGSDMTFTTLPAAPAVQTVAATGITQTTATMNGLVTANGASTTVTFDYGLTTAYGTTVPGIPSPVTGNTATAVSAGLTGLVNNTIYHYRVNGVNSVGPNSGADMTFYTNCPSAGPAGPITGPTQVCPGQCGYVYSVVITNATGYVWTLPIGATITSGANTNTITVCYASNSVTGNLSVYGTAPCGNSAQSTITVTVNSPANPTLSGPASVCVNSAGNVYTTQTGMTNYIWSVSAGGTITAGGGTANNTVTITWTTTGAKTVSVNYNNASGCPAINPTVYNVTVNSLPTPTISGPNPACSNVPGIIYTTQSGMTGYNWGITAGGTITAGQGTNSITVTWNATGSQNVSVNYSNSNGCTATAPVLYPVTVNTGANPTITGTTSVCANSGYYNYTTEAGMTAYAWTVSPGGVINYGGGTNIATVSWLTGGAQWVKVNYTNPSGCSAGNPTQLNVTVNSAPAPAGSVTGTASVCGGANGVAYSVAQVTDATSYVWTLPAGVTVASGSGTNSITVNFAGNASSGNINVYGNNTCGNGAASPDFPVIVTALPADAGIITGTSQVCDGETGVIFTVPTITGAITYSWTVPTGAIITTGGSTNSITVDFTPGAASGNITVAGINSCGSGNPSPNFVITVNPVPAPPLVTNTGYIVSSDAPNGNQWYHDGTLIPGANGQTHDASITGDGFYWTIVTLTGCSSDTSNHKYILLQGIDKNSSSMINVYPVPNDGKFDIVIHTTTVENFTISIFNTIGIRIYEESNVVANGSYHESIDLRPISKGVYTLVINNGKSLVTRKIVVGK